MMNLNRFLIHYPYISFLKIDDIDTCVFDLNYHLYKNKINLFEVIIKCYFYKTFN